MLWEWLWTQETPSPSYTEALGSGSSSEPSLGFLGCRRASPLPRPPTSDSTALGRSLPAARCTAAARQEGAHQSSERRRRRSPASSCHQLCHCAPAHGGGLRKSRRSRQVEGGVVPTVTARSWFASGPGAPAFPRPGRPERVLNVAFCGGRDLSLPPQLGVEERDRWGLLLIWCLLFVYPECSLLALQSLQTGRKAARLDHWGAGCPRQ